jgi:hypothetical protein
MTGLLWDNQRFPDAVRNLRIRFLLLTFNHHFAEQNRGVKHIMFQPKCDALASIDFTSLIHGSEDLLTLIQIVATPDMKKATREVLNVLAAVLRNEGSPAAIDTATGIMEWASPSRMSKTRVSAVIFAMKEDNAF